MCALLALIGTLSFTPHIAVVGATTNGTGATGLCDVTVPSGSSIIAPGVIELPNHTIYSYSRQECMADHPTRTLPTINEWTVWGAAGNASGVSYLASDWYVPNAPSNYNAFENTVNFLWIGIQPNGGAWIVQPVLGYGCTSSYGPLDNCISPGIGGFFWWISAYYVVNGQGTNTGAIKVNVGDHIYGSLGWSTNCNGSGQAGYYINVNDNSIGQGANLCYYTSSAAPNAYLALEDQRVTSCDELPNQSSETFYDVASSSSPPLPWTNGGHTGSSPQCSYNKGINPTTIHIHSYPTTDFYSRSHGLAKDQSLPVPWWDPYYPPSQYTINTTSAAFDHSETDNLAIGSHYVQEAASGSVPSYAWHTLIYINGALIAQGDVGRNQILQGNYNVNSFTLYWTP